MRRFADLECNGIVSSSKALVKRVVKELSMDQSYLNEVAAQVRKELGE
jgi:hypothetical protein